MSTFFLPLETRFFRFFSEKYGFQGKFSVECWLQRKKSWKMMCFSGEKMTENGGGKLLFFGRCDF